MKSLAAAVLLLSFPLSTVSYAEGVPVVSALPGRTPSPGPGAKIEDVRAFWRSYKPTKVVNGCTIRDGNNDGWDDIWLLIYEWPTGGGERTNIEGAPFADFDNDGISNYDEMLQGTDPHPIRKAPERTPEEKAESARLAAALRADEARERELMHSLHNLFRQEPLRHLDGSAATRESQDLDRDRASMAKAEIEAAKRNPVAEKAAVDLWMLRMEAARKPGEPSIQRPALIDENGVPQYVSSTSVTAADMTRTTQVLPNPNLAPAPAWTGAAPFNLTGAGIRIGHWDTTGAKTTHQEFAGLLPGQPSRVNSEGFFAGTPHQHATTSVSIMIAKGVHPAARGMAPAAKALVRDSETDLAGMRTIKSTTNSTKKCDILTCGYRWGEFGWKYADGGYSQWHGTSAPGEEDAKFGAYDTDARDIDDLLYDDPRELIVVSAGNEHGGGPPNNTPSTPVAHYESINGGAFVLKTTYRPRDGESGYDTMSGFGIAKNVLTVGAANLLPGGWTGPGSVSLAWYSGRGPTDCGRIKPDLLGSGLVSPAANYGDDTLSNDALLGTSSATVHVGGSLALLLEHWKNLYPGQPILSAAALKGLAIHSADECGAEGPDYSFGWGLLNTERAASLLSQDAAAGNHDFVKELSVSNNGASSFSITASGLEPLRVTMCYTDAPATAINPKLVSDVDTARLVRDLDLSISGPGGTPHEPYVLDPSSPASPPAQGKNRRDNVEQIEIFTPVPGGIYTVQVSPFGAISSAQPFAVIISGAQIQAAAPFRVVDFHQAAANTWSLLWPAVAGAVYGLEFSSDLVNWQAIPGDYVASQPMVSAEVTSPIGAARHFFRVRRLF